MEKGRKKISEKEKRRLKFVREARDQRNATKYNLDFTFPRSRNIGFKEKK